MNWRAHIDRDPQILAGKPRIKGTRISVELIVARLGEGWTVDQLIQAYPLITQDQIQACLTYAAESLATDEVLDIPRSAA